MPLPLSGVPLIIPLYFTSLHPLPSGIKRSPSCRTRRPPMRRMRMETSLCTSAPGWLRYGGCGVAMGTLCMQGGIQHCLGCAVPREEPFKPILHQTPRCPCPGQVSLELSSRQERVPCHGCPGTGPFPRERCPTALGVESWSPWQTRPAVPAVPGTWSPRALGHWDRGARPGASPAAGLVTCDPSKPGVPFPGWRGTPGKGSS